MHALPAGEVIARLWDPDASLWDWPNYALEMLKLAPCEAQFADGPALGWAPIAGSSGSMYGKPLSFTAEGTRAQNRDRPPATGLLI